MMSSQELSFTANVDRQFLRAANLLDLPPGLAQQIRTCNATYTVRFPVRLRERIANNQILDGALAVLLGVILAVVTPRLWPSKKRQDGWS